MEKGKHEFTRSIVLDLDRTLLDTQAFNKELAQIFQKFGKIDFYKTYPDAVEKNGIYSFFNHLLLIPSESDRRDVERAVEIIFLNIQRFLFPDVIVFLKTFEKDSIILLTRGIRKFQSRKVNNLNSRIFGNNGFFNWIFYTVLKKGEFAQKIPVIHNTDQTFFIDDDVQELVGIKDKLNNVRTILIDRYSEEKFPLPVGISHMSMNLKEAGDYILCMAPGRDPFIEALRELRRFY